jgi:hypothetical protein
MSSQQKLQIYGSQFEKINHLSCRHLHNRFEGFKPNLETYHFFLI